MSFAKTMLAVLALSVFLTGPAFAYIDPSSGSVVLQGIIAGVAAIVLTAKLWWHRLLVMLGIRKRTLKPGATTDATSDERK